MHVDVDDGDALEPRASIARCRDGDVVEQAEAHRAVRFGVVARWTHQREGGLAFGHRVLRRLNCAARREPRDVV